MSDKFLLIDGSSLIHRAFFALPPLTTKKGVNTGAVYGLCNFLLKLIGDNKPKYLAVAFDKSRETFRRKKYAEYKAQRKPTPSELSEQFPLSIELLKAMGIKVLEEDDYEADDIIGTLSTLGSKDTEVIIVTGDKDEFQLIDDEVKVFYTKRGISDVQVYDREEFAKNYEGLDPLKIIDLKGLMGDVSDNIPGVPGVGPKTALKLICEYQSVENVLEHIDDISGKSLKEKLTNNKEQALLSKELATIFKEVPVSKELADYELQGITSKARNMMKELEFRNLWERFAEVLGTDEPESMDLFGSQVFSETEHYERVEVKYERTLVRVLDSLEKSTAPLPMTYEVSGKLPALMLNKAEVLLEDKVYVFSENTANSAEFYDFLHNDKIQKALCDSKELYKVCLCHEKPLQGVAEDIMLAGYLYEAGENSYGLKALTDRYLGANDGGTVQDLKTLVEKFKALLEERELEKLYRTIELPLIPVLAKMEYYGIALDKEMLGAITVEMKEKVASLEEEAYKEAGEKFNLKSPKQLGVILFEKLNLPIIKKTKTGYSTDVTVLEQLEKEHPLVATILEHRKLSKLLSTYLEGLAPLVNPTTHRIHTHFQQAVTVTGRLSSTDPNLQNIPTRTEVGKRMREMFVPGEGFSKLLSCDYSQVELRVLAHISQDELLLDSFAKGQDVHARTAAEVFGLDIKDVSHAMRSKAKAVNFGIVYGISDYGLSKQLGITRGEAADYIAEYFKRYKGVKEYMDKMIELARKQGYVETMFGRRRYLPDIKHSNFNLRSFAERTAINTPIQGTAADIIKIAMIKVAKAIAEAKVKSRILLQVHDELVLEIVDEEEEQVAKLVKDTMENAITMDVKLTADVNTGRNWAETK